MWVEACDFSAAQKWLKGPEQSLRSAVDGRCLDVNGADGRSLALWDCHGRDNQKFVVLPGRVQDIEGKCLDAAADTEGRGVIMWPCHGRSNQAWSEWCALGTNALGAKFLPAALPAPARPPGLGRPPLGCAYGPWAEWSSCTKSCGGGHTMRSRSAGQPVCKDTHQLARCNEGACKQVGVR